MKLGIQDLPWHWSCGGEVFSGFVSSYREITIPKRRKRGQICCRQRLVEGMRKKLERKERGLGREWLTLIRTNLLVPQCGFHSRADSRSWFSQDRLFGSSSELPWYLQGCPNLALLPRLHSVCGLSIFLSVLTCDPSTGKTQTYSEGLLNSRFELAVAERVFGPGLVS